MLAEMHERKKGSELTCVIAVIPLLLYAIKRMQKVT